MGPEALPGLSADARCRLRSLQPVLQLAASPCPTPVNLAALPIHRHAEGQLPGITILSAVPNRVHLVENDVGEAIIPEGAQLGFNFSWKTSRSNERGICTPKIPYDLKSMYAEVEKYSGHSLGNSFGTRSRMRIPFFRPSIGDREVEAAVSGLGPDGSRRT